MLGQRAVINDWEQPRTRCASDQKVEGERLAALLSSSNIHLFPSHPSLSLPSRSTRFFISICLYLSRILVPHHPPNLRLVLPLHILSALSLKLPF